MGVAFKNVKKIETYKVVKISFAAEKGLLNSYFNSEKANLRNKQVWGKEGPVLDSLLPLYQRYTFVNIVQG